MQISMSWMMDKVLNLGLNNEVVTGLAARSGERFAAAPAVFCCLLLSPVVCCCFGCPSLQEMAY